MIPRIAKSTGQATPPERSLLFIDPDEELLALMEASFRGLHYRLFTTPSGRKGLNIVSTRPVDLVILDYPLPDIDGETLLRSILRARPQTSIIMYSAALKQVPNRVLSLVDEFVSKQEPISNLLYYIPRLIRPANRPKRRFPRYRVRVPFTVIDETAAGGVLRGESSDLSEGGLGGILSQELPLGREVQVHITLPTHIGIGAGATVRYSAGTRHGFQFLDLSPTQAQAIRELQPA